MNEKEKKLRAYLIAERERVMSERDAFAHRCKEYESFYLGDQWDYSDKLGYKPVFNITKRVCDYVISTLCSKQFELSYSLESFAERQRERAELDKAVQQLNEYVAFSYDSETLEKLLFDLVRDAVVYGSGFLFTHWDSGYDNGDIFKGRMSTSVIDPYRVYPADAGESSVEKQPYIIIRGRESREDILREMALHFPDEAEKFSKLGGGDICEVTLMLKKENGRVIYIKESGDLLISYGDTRLTRYPLCAFSPIPKKDSFFGYSYIEGMIPNQKYINKSYAMLMKHMQDTAFSKVIYDRSRIPEWTGEVGVAIAAHGGGNLSDCVSVVGCGKLEDGYLQLTGDIADRTKELYGATETALGNIEPKNTSAILAVKEASESQLRGCVILLTSALESQAYIWADMLCSYHTGGRKLPFGGDGSSLIHLIRDKKVKCRVALNDRSKFGSSVALSVLNELLASGAISPSEYIKRLPDGIISDKEGLIENAKQREASASGFGG